MGGSRAQTVGYWYHPVFLIGLCQGEIDTLLRVRGGDVEAWAGILSQSGTVHVDALEMWGGEESEGGMQGDLDVMFGEPGQQPNAYFQTAIGEDPSAHRGITTALWKGGRYGAMNPYPKPISFLPRRIYAGWHNNVCWYPEKAGVPLTEAERLGTAGFGGGLVPGMLISSSWAPLYALPAGEITITSRQQSEGGDEPYSPPRRITIERAGGVVWWDSGWLGQSTHQEDLDALLVAHGRTDLLGTILQSDTDDTNILIALVAAPMENLSIYIMVAGVGGSSHGAGFSVETFIDLAEQKAMNGAHIIYDSLTDPRMQGEPIELINDASFRAGADRLYAERFGLCTAYDPDQETVEAFRQRICDVIGAQCSRSTVDGKWYLDLIRGVSDIDLLPILTDDDILEFEASPSVLDDAVNQVAVKWFDPFTKQARITAPVHSLGAIQAMGSIVAETKEYPELPNEALADRVAARDLSNKSTPLWRKPIKTNRKPWSWRLGTYFRLMAPKYGVADMVCLVGEIDKGTLRSGAISLVAVQDVFSMPAASYVVGQPSIPPPDRTPEPAPYQRVLEAPFVELAGVLAPSDLAALDDDAGFLLAVGARPSAGSTYQLQVQPAGGEFESAGTFDWCPTAVVVEPSSFDPAEVEFTLSTGSLLDRVIVGTAALWGEELVRVDALNVATGAITLGRGCGDTVAHKHAAAQRIWFYDTWASSDQLERATAEVVAAKLLSRTGTAILPIAEATAMPLTFAQRQARPYPPAALLVNGEIDPASIVGEVVLTWAHRDRLLQADQLVDQSIGSTGPEPGTTYTVRWLMGGVLVETQSGITGTTTSFAPEGSGLLRIELESVRDGLVSWQLQVREVSIELPPGEGGSDDFDADTLGMYTIYRDGGTPNVAISGGYLNFNNPLGATQVVVARTGSSLADCLLTGVLTEAHDAGIAFRLTDSSNYYVATIHDDDDMVPASRSTVALWRRSGGGWSMLGARTSIPTFVRGVPHEFQVSAIGSALQVKVNDVAYISVTDSTHVAGLHGPRAESSPVKFDSYAWEVP